MQENEEDNEWINKSHEEIGAPPLNNNKDDNEDSNDEKDKSESDDFDASKNWVPYEWPQRLFHHSSCYDSSDDDDEDEEEEDPNANDLPDLEYIHSPRLPAEWFTQSI